MEGILPILIIIISALSAIAKAQKKKEANKKGESAPQAPAPVEAPSSHPVAAAPIPAPQPMSAFEPAPAGIGTEGEDACHAYMLPDVEIEKKPVLETEENEALSQDLLKGVILSEILQRPQPRAYGRRRA